MTTKLKIAEQLLLEIITSKQPDVKMNLKQIFSKFLQIFLSCILGVITLKSHILDSLYGEF